MGRGAQQVPWARAAVLLPLPPPLWAHAQPAPAHPHACLQINIYADEDGARKEEIAQLRLGTADNVFRWGMGWGCAACTHRWAVAGWSTCRPGNAAPPMLALYLRSWVVLLHPLAAPRRAC